MTRPLPLLALALLGCSEEPEDTSSPTDTESEEEDGPTGCETTEVFADGPESPVVGDSWTVLLHCDGAVMMGPMVLSLDPPDFASVAGNTITWTQAGTCTLTVQVGSEEAAESVTVAE